LAPILADQRDQKPDSERQRISELETESDSCCAQSNAFGGIAPRKSNTDRHGDRDGYDRDEN
jgi:hypothetical protein